MSASFSANRRASSRTNRTNTSENNGTAATEPEWVAGGRIPCLDGLRALAIIMVVASHLSPQIQSPVLSSIPLVSNGHLGVVFFFVISGFLITLLMLREQEKFGEISLKGFYLRRLLRISPALTFFLLIMAGAQLAGLMTVGGKYWLAGLTYTMCYMPFLNSAWAIGHTWSLSVEEHFYLLWPVMFCLMKPAKAFKFLLGYLIITPVLRYVIWSLHKESLDIDFCSLTQMSSIATGCLCAFIVKQHGLDRLRSLIQNHAVLFIGLGLLVLLFAPLTAHSGKYVILFSDPVNALAIALLMLGILYSPQSYLFRALNFPPLTGIGILSYSIYLWQQPFTGGGFLAARLAAYHCHWLINVIFILILAALSYRFVEVPFLRLRSRGREARPVPLQRTFDEKEVIAVATRPSLLP